LGGGGGGFIRRNFVDYVLPPVFWNSQVKGVTMGWTGSINGVNKTSEICKKTSSKVITWKL